MGGTRMNPKYLKGLRIVLYSVAILVLVDMFFYSTPEKEADQLSVYHKKPNVTYIEYFINYVPEDSSWYILQTNPAIGQSIRVDFKSPWRYPVEFENEMKRRNLKFEGIYLGVDMILTKRSFYLITERFDTLNKNKDRRLNNIHKEKSFTAIFIRM